VERRAPDRREKNLQSRYSNALLRLPGRTTRLSGGSKTRDDKVLLAIALFALAPTAAHSQPSASPYTSAARYDAVGRVTGTIAPDPDGAGPLHHAAVRNTYDGAGRLTKVETGELAAWQSEAVAPANWADFTIYRTAETLYDTMGRKVRDTLRDGTGGVAGTVRSVTQYSYDAVGRPNAPRSG